MKEYATNIDIEPAVKDLWNRSLSRLPGDFERLTYLASSRDYNTGRYYHDGLAFHFNEEVASRAMAACHTEIFERLLYSSLEHLLEELHGYASRTEARLNEVVEAWSRLASYRLTIPLECDELAAQFFVSNVKVALAILERGWKSTALHEQAS